MADFLLVQLLTQHSSLTNYKIVFAHNAYNEQGIAK